MAFQTVPLGKLANYYLHPKEPEGPAENRYHICITFKDLKFLSGTVRCQGIVNARIGAEIYIQNGIKSNAKFHAELDFNQFILYC